MSFRLDVGPDGNVHDCTIINSSGSASLDETTCRLLQVRARFLPARDREGRATGDSVHGRVAWRLVDEDPVALDGDNRAPPPTTRLVQRTRPLAPLESYVDEADFPAAARGHASVTSWFVLSVDADGRVTDCAPSVVAGASLLDDTACRLMRDRARFTPARDAAGKAAPDRYWGHIRWRLFEGTPPASELDH